jgi:hypothetical protein
LPVVVLKVRDRYGALAELRFRVDPQADVTAVPIRLAEEQHLPYSRARQATARGMIGKVRKYRDRVRIVIAGREHDWPCDFTEPAIDPETREPLPGLSPVLGRAGLLQEYVITMDSEYLVVTRIGPVRRWFRRRLHRLWELCRLVHPQDQPL